MKYLILLIMLSGCVSKEVCDTVTARRNYKLASQGKPQVATNGMYCTEWYPR